MPGFEELDVWKRAVEPNASIYRETKELAAMINGLIRSIRK
jgi:hypothetical protein